MNYIGLGVITEVDSIYMAANKTGVYKAFSEDESFPPYKVFDNKYKNINKKDRGCCNFIMYFIYRFVKVFYSFGYFYFFPLLVFNLTY